jgi:DNA uptake protein ComE-like DNA-binding protein
VRLVDLNSASRSDLKTLPGIDDAAADRIIAARPYPSKAKLVAERVVSMELFLSLKDRVVALQQPPLRAIRQSSRQP